MPELIRNFLKGRMNKDLDERVVPAGEYRDALNVEISTSDASDVGAVENLSGNFRSNKIGFIKVTHSNDTTLSAGTSRFSFSLTADLADTAETIGTVTDTTTDKIYNFVANASDIDESGSWPYVGVKSDAIIECETLDRGSGLSGFRQVVLCDVYRVQRKAVSSSTPSANINLGSQPTGFADSLIGIEQGMTCDLIDVNGISRINLITQGANLPTVSAMTFVTNAPVVTLDQEVTGVADAITAYGDLVWRFEKPRFLNFNSSNQIPTTIGGSDSTATPVDNAIFGIDIIDNFLFFTDNKTEPKKIKIDRFAEGGIFGTRESHTIFYTTRLLRSLNSQGTVFAGTNTSASAGYSSPIVTTMANTVTHADIVEEEHITVIKRQPTAPPTLETFTAPKEGSTASLFTDVDVTSINLSTYEQGDSVTIQMAATTLFEPGDLISLVGVSGNTNAVIQLIVDAIPPNTLSDTSFDCTVFRTDLNATELAAGTIPNTGVTIADSSTTWHATLGSVHGTVNTDTIYKEKFPRFAYRWRYVDGEVSTISPFTKPVFVPGTYKFSTKTDAAGVAECFNTGMENTVQTIRLKDFLPTDAPKDVVEVEILQAFSDSNSIYNIKTFKILDFFEENANAFVPNLVRAEHRGTGFDNNPTASGGPDTYFNNIGVFDITSDLFGNVIEENQLLRNFDNVPKAAKAQAISANRVIYGNYLQNYNVETENRRPVKIDFDLSLKSIPNTHSWDASDDEFDLNTFAIQSTESLKSNRTYEVGVVFKDKFGRETPVLTGENSSITVPNTFAPATIKLQVFMKNKVPSWVHSYKFYIKETSNEYYNLALYKAYNASAENTNGEAWLLFNSADSSKVQEGDTLILKKRNDDENNYSSSVNKFLPSEYKVLAKSSTAPSLAKGVNSFDSSGNADPNAEGSISAADRDGKFFVKVKNDTDLVSFIQDFSGGTDKSTAKSEPAIFETKPDPDINLNIWYEASQSYPVKVTEQNMRSIVHAGDKVQIYEYASGSGSVLVGETDLFGAGQTPLTVSKISGPDTFGNFQIVLSGNVTFTAGAYLGTIHFLKDDGSAIAFSLWFGSNVGIPGYYGTGNVGGDGSTSLFMRPFSCNVDNELSSMTSSFARLNWFNSISFGNGVESDRIRDDFNEVQLNNGIRASSTFDSYSEDRRRHGLIFSGIYNSNSSVNNLNQFIQAEPITKDINPLYGSIQKIFSRNTDLLVFAEDKVLKILANKDALFNAGGNANLTSSNAVLGQAIPYAGDYGISTDPLSFAADEYRCYFADRQRGAVIRLSRDGITPISAIGMSDYFTDTFAQTTVLVGSYDDRKQEYNLTIHSGQELINNSSISKDVTTISYSENAKGWSSFKSFIPERGISINNNYYTFQQGKMWIHHYDKGSGTATNAPNGIHKANNFYGVQYDSSITPVFNDVPSAVKSFTTLNYGGTQARILQDITGVLSAQTNSGANTLIFTTDFEVPTGVTITASETGIPAGTTVASTSFVTTTSGQGNLIITMSANATQNIPASAIITFYDEEWYNNMPAEISTGRPGWYVESIATDLQDGQIADFRRKESKWYNFIRGVRTSHTNSVTLSGGIVTDAVTNLDSQEFSYQGIGVMGDSDTAQLAGGESIASGFVLKLSDSGDADVSGAVNPYTVSETILTELTGTQSGTAAITITPDDGLFLQASDFTISGGTASSGTTFTGGSGGVTLPSQITSVTFTNTATSAQLTAGDTQNTILATATFSGFTISGDLDLQMDIDLATVFKRPLKSIPISHLQRITLKANKFINENHTLSFDHSAQPNLVPSSSITGSTRYSFNSSTDVLTFNAGFLTATANAAGSVTGTTHVLTSDVASSILAGANLNLAHGVVNASNNNVFLGNVESVADLGSTTSVVLNNSVTVAQNATLNFADYNVHTSGSIGTYEGFVNVALDQPSEICSFTITCASNFKITNSAILNFDSGAQPAVLQNNMISFTSDPTFDGDGNKTAEVLTLFYNIPSGSPQALFGQSGNSSTGTQGSILLTYNISAT